MKNIMGSVTDYPLYNVILLYSVEDERFSVIKEQIKAFDFFLIASPTFAKLSILGEISLQFLVRYSSAVTMATVIYRNERTRIAWFGVTTCNIGKFKQNR